MAKPMARNGQWWRFDRRLARGGRRCRNQARNGVKRELIAVAKLGNSKTGTGV